MTTALDHSAVHVRVRVDKRCPDELLYVVVDVDGTPIAVILWHEADASPGLVRTVEQVRDSIRS